MPPFIFYTYMFGIKEMGMYAGSMRNGVSSRIETIQVNGEVLKYQVRGNQRLMRNIHDNSCMYIPDNRMYYGEAPELLCQLLPEHLQLDPRLRRSVRSHDLAVHYLVPT